MKIITKKDLEIILGDLNVSDDQKRSALSQFDDISVSAGPELFEPVSGSTELYKSVELGLSTNMAWPS